MMKLYVVGVLYFLTVQCIYIPEFLKEDFFNIHKYATVATQKIGKTVTRDHVTFYLYTAKNPDQYTQLNHKNLTALTNENCKIVFIIHGWTENRGIQWYEDMKNAFFIIDRDTYCVVEVDWSEPATQFYYISAYNTYDVARYIAELIGTLIESYPERLNDILLVGFSLGGQVVGLVGKNVQRKIGKKLPRIIALDPAGPLFVEKPKCKRLHYLDAEVVEVVHTSGGTFGFREPCGTIDFFPNGGSFQMSCVSIDIINTNIKDIPIELVACHHNRAHEYFIEALLNPNKFLARRCRKYGVFFLFNICEKVVVRLGDLTTEMRGNFYFETNSPFSWIIDVLI